MNIVFLDGDTLGSDSNLDVFSEFGNLTIYGKTSLDETISRAKNADIIITNKVILDKKVIDECPKLKLICISATGMNNVDLKYSKEKNIEVKNIAGYSTQSVAQYTLMQALNLLGKSRFYDDYVKEGKWVKSPIFVNLDRSFNDIENKKWGIIGLGAIGKEVAVLAKAFKCEVCYHSTSGKNTKQDYKHLQLDELLKTCDIISIHAPLNEQTNNLIDKDKLALLKQDAILINVARGGIINEEALVKVINDEKIYACIDVLTKEPMSENSPYLKVVKKDRILFSPHVAWGSVEARKRLIQGIVNNIKGFINGKRT